MHSNFVDHCANVFIKDSVNSKKCQVPLKTIIDYILNTQFASHNYHCQEKDNQRKIFISFI